MQYFSCRSVGAAIALCTTLVLQAAAASATCSSGVIDVNNPNTSPINNTGTSEWTPTSDFTINGDDTVTHVKTGLMWKRRRQGDTQAEYQSGDRLALTWAEALKAAVAANNSKFAGYADWRLPNKKELESIINVCGISGQARNKTVFPSNFGDLWTSTTHPSNPTIAYSVNFGYGTTRVYNLKTAQLEVLLVRAGRTADSADLLKP